MAKPSKGAPEAKVRTRRRSSVRRLELIEVAGRLFASRGYNSVTVDDISDAVGLTGPALYRHFPSKEALLVAVFDQVIELWTDWIRAVVAEAPDARSALYAMVRLHVEFAIDQRENMAVWRQEFNNLPEADRSRLRRAQRLYVEEWVHVVLENRPDFSDSEARAAVHAALGLLQSPSDYQSGLPVETISNLLMSMALVALEQGTTQPLAPPVTTGAKTRVRSSA
jgi:AcrR family transcriptional regulator